MQPLASTLGYKLFARFRAVPISDDYLDIACIITAYKDLSITKSLLESLQHQTYKRFHVYLVADHCTGQEIAIEDERITVLFPDPPLSSKVKSLQYAFDKFKRTHDAVLIFDADNVAHPHYLERMNEAFNHGYDAVQGQRIAKNLGTHTARLDSMSEFYYNFMVRKVPFGLGSSSTIAGSAMAMRTAIFKDYLQLFEAEEGLVISEDKILQTWLVSNALLIAYAEKAIVLDEKVSGGEAVQRQRTRWLASYFEQFRSVFVVMLKGIKTTNWNQFYFGFICTFPPLVFLVLSAGIGLFISLFISWGMFQFMMFAIMCFVLNFVWALYLNRTPSTVLSTLPKIPLFILYQIKALLGMDAVKSDFLTTDHDQHFGFEESWQVHYSDSYRTYIETKQYIQK